MIYSIVFVCFELEILEKNIDTYWKNKKRDEAFNSLMKFRKYASYIYIKNLSWLTMTRISSRSRTVTIVTVTVSHGGHAGP